MLDPPNIPNRIDRPWNLACFWHHTCTPHSQPEQFWCGVLQYHCNCAGLVHSSRGCTAQGLQHEYREWRPERSLIHTGKYILHSLTLFFCFWPVIGGNFSICIEDILTLGSPFGYMEKELLPVLHFHSCHWSSWTHQNHRISCVGRDPQWSLSPTPALHSIIPRLFNHFPWQNKFLLAQAYVHYILCVFTPSPQPLLLPCYFIWSQHLCIAGNY